MRSRLVAGALACSFGAACSSASAPSPSAPAPNVTAVAVTSVTATVEKVSTGAVYHISFQVKETGGQSGATISTVLFTLKSSPSTLTSTYTPSTTQRVPAGGSLDLGPVNITDTTGASTSIASEISVAVSFTDDAGRGGSVTATASIAHITYTLSGLVTDGTSGPSGRMPGVVVQVLDGVNAGLSAVTDGTGNYTISGISAGSLTLSASITDYETTTQSVTVSGNTHVDLVLPRKSINLGAWTGTGGDSIGSISLTWALTQTGSAVSGTVQMQSLDAAGSCNSCHRVKSGTLSGTTSGSTLALTIFFPGNPGELTPICSATLSGTASNFASGTLNVAYSGGDTCEGTISNGSIVMTR